MDRLGREVTASLPATTVDHLRQVFAEMAEEAEEHQRVMRMTAETLLQNIKELEASMKTEREERQKELYRMLAAVESAKMQQWRIDSEAVMKLQQDLRRVTEEKEEERKKCVDLDTAKRWALLLLERKNRKVQKVTRDNQSVVVSAAAMKQKMLRELKTQADQWMVAPRESSDMDKPPMVLKTWMLREEWRKLQGNRPCLNDRLQSFCKQQEIAEITLQHQMLQREVEMDSEKKRRCLMSEFVKQEQKIMAAQAKEKAKLAEKMRKEMEKIQKAEMEKKKKQDAKLKKEADKLAKKKAKEEAAQTRPARFSFWRKAANAK